jgi:transposase
VKSATSTNTLPEQPPNGVTGGLDWAHDDHAVSVVDTHGREIRRRSVEHSAAGLRELVEVLRGAGAGEVAIERPDGPVVDAMLAAGMTVVVISPNQVKNLIVTSLPRAGRVRAARLLAEIGDCRARFPTPESLTCLAGVAPSTRQSGKTRAVGFRWACDKQLRDAVTDFAGDTRHANPWAADLYQRARDRGHDHPHAVRILARAWLNIIWRCWQDGVAYDPTKHRALQRHIKAQQEAG